jgi:hypothetical protein
MSQCSDSPEVPREILDKYKKSKKSREFKFKDTDRKTILAKGVVEDVILVYHDDYPREYWKGVEKLRFNNGRVEFRFMYWARKKGQTNAKWRWGQFNVCLPQDHLNKLIECMQKKGWIKLH